jgi:hypothetical protein
VSLLWRDEVGIYVAPERILLVRTQRGLRPRKVAERSISIAQTETHDWQPALAALDAELADSTWHGANTSVVISDHWARYAVLPPNPLLKSVTEKLNHAHHIFSDIYGDIVNDWKVAISDSAIESGHIGSALPNALLEHLTMVLTRYGMPLVSVQPQLISSFNRWSGYLPAGGAWFITIEAGSLAAARVVPNGWDRVYTLRIGSDWQIDLRRLQKFGQLASMKANDGQVFVDAPVTIRHSAQPIANVLRWLDDHQPKRLSTLDHLHLLRRNAVCPALP